MRLSTLKNPILGLVLVWASIAPAHVHAMDCGDIDSDGVCLDTMTLQWCEDGTLKDATCPEDHICVEQTPWYDAAGCVPLSETDCGDIPSEGQCTTANSVVWCVEGSPRVQLCDDNTVCGWNSDDGWYDCLTTPPSSADSDAGELAQYPDTTDDDDAPQDGVHADAGPTPDGRAPSRLPSSDTSDHLEQETSSAPTPTVTPGDDEVTTTAADGGCHGGSSPHPTAWFYVLALVCVGRFRRLTA